MMFPERFLCGLSNLQGDNLSILFFLWGVEAATVHATIKLLLELCGTPSADASFQIRGKCTLVHPIPVSNLIFQNLLNK